MIETRVYEGQKASFYNGTTHYDFCYKDNNDTDTVYDILAEGMKLNDSNKELINFQNLKDGNVKTMLQDAKKQGFISDYEIENF